MTPPVNCGVVVFVKFPGRVLGLEQYRLTVSYSAHDTSKTTGEHKVTVRIRAGLVAAAIAVGVSLFSASTANADESFTVGAVSNNCGIATCSVYISRSGTRSIDRFADKKVAEWGKWGAETAVCGALGFVPYVGVPLGIYCGFRFEQFDQVLDEAADKNKCFKVTYTRPLPGSGATTVTHISTNNGDFCED